MRIETLIDIYPHTLVRSSNKSDLIDFILQVDLEVAEVDFTIQLIKKLKESLKSDLSEKEIDEY